MVAKKMPAKKMPAKKTAPAVKKPKNLGLGDNAPVGGVGSTAAAGGAAAAILAGTLALASSGKNKGLKPYTNTRTQVTSKTPYNTQNRKVTSNVTKASPKKKK